jgi:hypothetical protein
LKEELSRAHQEDDLKKTIMKRNREDLTNKRYLTTNARAKKRR